ncbi:MAG TPA: glycosyltransferase family 4 protein [Verrucomicrobiae bacterium]|nr:glycosyltransferase family 4 protein [Verrucomicrobiae bacterium]
MAVNLGSAEAGVMRVGADDANSVVVRNGDGLRIAWLGHKSQTIGDGLRTYSRIVTTALEQRGVEVVFVHHERALDDGRSSFSLRGTPVFQRRVVVSGTRSGRTLEGILRDHSVDVVHLSAPFSTLDFTLPRICRRLGVPVVVTFHVPFTAARSMWGSLASAVTRLYARALAECDRVIVSGEAQWRLLAQLGVPEHVLSVLPNGVDLDKYSPGPSDVRAALGAERLFTFVGRVDPEKRVETLLRAFLEVSPPPSTHLVVVGDGFDLPRLKARYRDPRVVFTGAVLDERRRIDILRASDAFFLPSDVEAQSLALLEAMACGIAVAATRVGNHAEMLEGIGTLLDPKHLLHELRTAIASFVRSRDLCLTMGMRARLRAIQRYGLSAHINGVLALYAALVGCGPLSPQ